MATKKETELKLQLNDNNHLTYNFVDAFQIGARSDGLFVIQFYTKNSNTSAVEQTRIVTTTDGISKLSNLLNLALQHSSEKISSILKQ